jgi:hypothetical protein
MLCRQKSLAWHYLQLGNRIMAAHVQHDLRKEQRNLHNIKGIFRAPFVTSGVQDRSSIFIVGMPRSGSTLVEQMLASHSQVFVHSAQGGGGRCHDRYSRCPSSLWVCRALKAAAGHR